MNTSEKEKNIMTGPDFRAEFLHEGVLLTELKYFDLGIIFDCGQCFRFDPLPENSSVFTGTAYGKFLRAEVLSPSSVMLCGVSGEDFVNIWYRFFALDLDYGAVNEEIERDFDAAYGRYDENIRRAEKASRGIRVLRQQPFETLISFIISQNNNISRIKKNVAALCEKYGEPVRDGNGNVLSHAFPAPEAIADAGIDAMTGLKTGFRAKYIIDAAERTAGGRCSPDKIEKMSSAECLEKLMEIKGVGPKVASCTALFGYAKYDCFPIDVWISRTLNSLYGGNLDCTKLGRYAGIAQQYLFNYQRNVLKG